MGFSKTMLMEAEEAGLATATAAYSRATGLDLDAAEECLLSMGAQPAPAMTADDATAMRNATLNPLGLVASDLLAVGWESRDGVTWENAEETLRGTFHNATAFEASRIGLCANPFADVETF